MRPSSANWGDYQKGRGFISLSMYMIVAKEIQAMGSPGMPISRYPAKPN